MDYQKYTALLINLFFGTCDNTKASLNFIFVANFWSIINKKVRSEGKNVISLKNLPPRPALDTSAGCSIMQGLDTCLVPQLIPYLLQIQSLHIYTMHTVSSSFT